MRVVRHVLVVGVAAGLTLGATTAHAEPVDAPAPASEADVAVPALDLGSLIALDGIVAPSPELVAARDSLVAANKTAEIAAEAYNAAGQVLANAQAKERTAIVAVASAKVREAEAARALGRFASEAYIAGGASANVAALLDSPTPKGMVERRNTMAAAGTASADLLSALEVAQEQSAEASQRASAARQDAAEARTGALRARDEAQRAADEATRLLGTMYSDAQIDQAAAQAAVDAQTLRAQMLAAGVQDITKPTAQAAAAVQVALDQVGKAYVWGAQGPDVFDCSGLTSWAYQQVGVSMPRTSQEQFAGLAKVSQSDIAPGDLVFFGSPVHHVGMYIGNGMMVHAPHPGDVVRVAPAFWADYVGAARPSVAGVATS